MIAQSKHDAVKLILRHVHVGLRKIIITSLLCHNAKEFHYNLIGCLLPSWDTMVHHTSGARQSGAGDVRDVCVRQIKMDAGFADQCGLSVTCKSRKALELYNTVIELFISQTEEFVSSLKNILELDPDFVLARCLLVSIIINI